MRSLRRRRTRLQRLERFERRAIHNAFTAYWLVRLFVRYARV
jgi:hypothetical protein